MGSVPNLLKQRWATGELVGEAAHACLVRIRQGTMNHLYQKTRMLDASPSQNPLFPIIWKGNHAHPWQGQWVPDGDWITLPNIQSASWTRDLSSNGGSVLTVVMDNVAFNEATGAAGDYHTIDRGWYSPTRGVKVKGRARRWPENDWSDVLNAGYQIDVWEGYGTGDDIVPVLDEDTHHWSAPGASRTWLGWIDEVDLESHPDHVTLTCRDGSILLTDQRIAGWNKDRAIRSPVTFADRKRTLGETKQYGHVRVSSGEHSSDERTGVEWLSDVNNSPTDLEWIEIQLPAGHYQAFYTDLKFDGETMYISLKANGGHCKLDTATHLPDGWVDLGKGNVPGTSIPYVDMHSRTWAWPSRRWSISGGHWFELGDDSVLRIWFTSLANRPGGYKAGVNAFYAFQFGDDPQKVNKKVKAKGWVLVEDAADVVRMILLWAGFHEFDVHNFGWTLEAPMQFGQDAFFIDAISKIMEQGNWLFYVNPPTDHDMSLGVPVFKPQTATNPAPGGMLHIQDTQLIEALSVKWDKSNLPYVLRFRGAQTDKGVSLFADRTKRYMGSYWPPWAGHDYTSQPRRIAGGWPLERIGGVRRHFTQTDPALRSTAECLFACILAAIQYCLQAVTGQFQIPGRPGVGLNQQISVIDEGTGTTSRMWVASVDSQHTLGPDGNWHMTVGGSMLDTEDMNLIARDYQHTYKRYVRARGPSK